MTLKPDSDVTARTRARRATVGETVPAAPGRLSATDLAYAAGVIDTLASFKTRTVKATGTQLPALTILNGKHRHVAVEWLCGITDTNPSTVKRDYNRPSCVSHCPQPHIHVLASGIRWSVTGMKATIILSAVLPYLKAHRDEAAKLIELGLQVGYSTTVVNTMNELGWPIPKLRAQTRTRVERRTS